MYIACKYCGKEWAWSSECDCCGPEVKKRFDRLEKSDRRRSATNHDIIDYCNYLMKDENNHSIVSTLLDILKFEPERKASWMFDTLRCLTIVADAACLFNYKPTFYNSEKRRHFTKTEILQKLLEDVDKDRDPANVKNWPHMSVPELLELLKKESNVDIKLKITSIG